VHSLGRARTMVDAGGAAAAVASAGSVEESVEGSLEGSLEVEKLNTTELDSIENMIRGGSAAKGDRCGP